MDNLIGEGVSSVGQRNELGIVLPDIDIKLVQLKYCETDLRNDGVEKAKIALHRVFDPRFKWFQSRNIIITYHGSLQYNDPSNLDLDVEFARDNLVLKDVRGMIRELENEFKKPGVWPREKCDTNFGVSSISGIKRGLREFEGKKHYDPNPKEDYDSNPELDASLILSSKALYGNQEPQLEDLRKKIRKLLAGNQWLREGVLSVLTGVVSVRQKRRELQS